VKVGLGGKEDLKKILTKEEILRGHLKVREEVKAAAPVACLGSSHRAREEVQDAPPATCAGWFRRGGS
jgi:hypothetical protein